MLYNCFLLYKQRRDSKYNNENYENDKERLRQQEINPETYLKKKKTKRENTEKTDIRICLKKRNKD